MKLYDMTLSGNCYKVRLLCSLIGLQYQIQTVNLAAGDHKQTYFLQLNPRGQVPVLEDNGLVLWDSTAILTYLARQYGAPHWLPTEAVAHANVMQWLALAQNELLYGLARARAIKLFARPWDLSQCQELGKAGLAVLETQLAAHTWLANNQLSIADIACYPYVALAEAGDIPLTDYPNIQKWLHRIQQLPGYTSMPGIGR